MSDETMNLRDIPAPVWRQNQIECEDRLDRLEQKVEHLYTIILTTSYVLAEINESKPDQES